MKSAAAGCAVCDAATELGRHEEGIVSREDDLEAYHRLLIETNQAYAALRADEAAWRAELVERQAWEVTVADGLEGEPWEESGHAPAAAPSGD
jgi:hypothetical protein